MGTQARRSRRKPSPPSTTVQSAENAFRHHREREKETNELLHRKAAAIVEESRRRLRDLAGGKRCDELREAIRRERLALRELRQPPEGMKRDFWKDQRAGKRRIDALLRTLGVGSSKVKRIQDDTGRKLREVLAPARRDTGPGYSLANHHDKWQELTGLGSTDLVIAPPPEDPNNPNRWFWFMPPYSNCYHHGVPGEGNFAINWQSYCTRATAYQENSLYMFILRPPYERPAKIMSFNQTTGDDPPVMGDRLIPGAHY